MQQRQTELNADRMKTALFLLGKTRRRLAQNI